LSDRVANALKAVGFVVDAVDEDGAQVSMGGKSASLRFENLKRMLTGAPNGAQEQMLIRRFARLACDTLHLQKETPAQLRQLPGTQLLFPRLGPIPTEKSMDDPWSKPMAKGSLRLMLVEDRPGSVRFVHPMDFVRWRLGLAQAQELAEENLIRKSQEIRPVPLDSPGIFEIFGNDGHDHARVLILHHWFADAALAKGGWGCFVSLPTRDSLWVAPVRDRTVVSAAMDLWTTAQEVYATEANPISPELFWWDGTSLTPVCVRQTAPDSSRIELPIGLQDCPFLSEEISVS